MPTLFQKTSNWIWYPDADATNAPSGALLRATNVVPDEQGGASLRAGKTTLYSGFQDTRVQTLHTPALQGSTYRFAGAGQTVYRDGFPLQVEFSGRGDISMGDDAYQAFFARGNTRRKFDGENFHNWGIEAPKSKVTLTAVDAPDAKVASFDSNEKPEFDINEGTSNFVNNYRDKANKALQLIPDSGTGRASCSKKYKAPQDFINIGGSIGGDTDLFDIRVWLEEPRKVDKVTFMFGLTPGDDPFADDYFHFEFLIKNDGKVKLKKEQDTALQAYKASTSRLLAALTPSEITAVQSPEQAGAIVKRLTSLVGQESFERPDSQQNSPAWGHFTVNRSQFKRVGKGNGDWRTVRGFKIVYTVIPGSTKSLYVDDAIWVGGGARSLTGTFRIGYRFARLFRDTGGNEIYTELSPMSPLSDEITLAQQTMQITIPNFSLQNKDAQVNQCWVYIYGGWLDTFYRVAVTSAFVNSGMTIDELTNPSGGGFDGVDKARARTRLTSHGFTYTQLNGQGVPAGTGPQDLILTLRKTEVDILIENEIFEPGAAGPPENIISIAGPWRGRMFALTQEGWLYVSSAKRPSSFSLYQTIDLRKYGTPYWVVKTTGGVFVGCSEDIIRIAGSGQESSNHVQVDLYAEELNVANPPVDACVTQDGNAILYRSADGLQMFSGHSVEPVPYAGTSLLWRGYDRHGVDRLNTAAGRFRLAVDNHNLYMLAPEESVEPETTVTVTAASGIATCAHTEHGFETDDQVKISGSLSATFNDVHNITVVDDDTYTFTVPLGAKEAPQTLKAIKASDPIGVWRYMPAMNPPQWVRLQYGNEVPLSIHREETGQLLIGTSNGSVLEVENETSDDGSGVNIDILTPWQDDGKPLSRKDAADLQVQLNSGNEPLDLNLYKDGSDTASMTLDDVASDLPGVYRANLEAFGTFLRAQLELQGEVRVFNLHGLGLSYRDRAQQVMVLDTGHIIPPNGGDIVWLTDIELDCYSAANLQMKVYKDGSLFDTAPIPVTPGIRDVYRINAARNTKGRRLRIVFITTNSNSAGDPGFEPYALRVRHKGAGNMTELPFGSGDTGNI
jgi:hypothetical protein